MEEALAALIASMLAVGVMSVLLDSGPTPDTTVTLRIPRTLPTAPLLTTTTTAGTSSRATAPPAPAAPASDTDAVAATAQAAAQRVICRSLTAPELNEFVAVYRAQGPGTSTDLVADAWLKQRFLEETRQCFLRYAGARS